MKVEIGTLHYSREHDSVDPITSPVTGYCGQMSVIMTL